MKTPCLYPRRLPALVVAALTAGCGGGGSSSPSGPSITISAPTPVSPAAGTVVTSDQPTLTVSNASVSNGSTPTYTFQVATEGGFQSIAAQGSGIAQGADGQTSWQVTAPLEDGRHFWRVRARAANTDGPFSASVEFTVTALGSGKPGEEVLLFDPLTDGTSLGDVGGGEFTEEGWKVIASSNFIVYDMPTIETGFLEFDITGVDIRNPTRNARHLFFMWDPSLGSDMTRNRFRVSLQKLDGRSSINDRWLRLRFISQGKQTDASSTFRGWIPDRTYHIRLEWGREGNVNVCRLFIDDRELMFFQYPKPYIPAIHRIELGAAGRAETPENAVYANVVIGRRGLLTPNRN
ncbi:MAG: hypothetical protein ACE5JI_16805 [Acidobacteriota bacterium]